MPYNSVPCRGSYISPEPIDQLRDLKNEVRRLIIIIAPYPDHLSSCPSNTEQTSEYCDCGFSKAAAAYGQLERLTR